MRWYLLAAVSIVVSSLTLVGAGWFFRPYSSVMFQRAASGEDAMLPTMQVQDVHLVEQTDAGMVWELFAKEAALYTAKHLAVVSQVQARLLQSVTGVWHVAAAHGQVDSTTGDMTVWGRVELQHPEGYTLETETLHWHAASRSLHTDTAVQVRSASVQLSGTGLRSEVDQQRFALQHAVRGAFQLRLGRE
jgi:LPS export ABC transporter protein LptC